MQTKLAAIALLVCATRAQTSPQARLASELATAGGYGNYAAEGSATDARGLPVGHTFAVGFSTVVAGASNSAAETVIGWEQGEGGILATSVSEQATGWARNGAMQIGTMASAVGRSNEGPHALRMRIRAAAGTRGKIELWAMGFASASARVSIAVDVGDEGVIDFVYTAVASVLFERRQWDVSLGPSGRLDVLIVTDGRAAVSLGQRATNLRSGRTIVWHR